MIDQQRKQQVKEIYERQVDRVYRTALIYTGNPHDAEDAVESVFLTVIEKGITFKNEEHEKAWFITAVRNRCKDLHKSSWRNKVELVAPTEVYSGTGSEGIEGRASVNGEEESVRKAAELLMKLPQDWREAVYLCYYEGYTINEASSIMGIKESKLRSSLASAKRLLRRNRDE